MSMKEKIKIARVDKRTLHATVALNWNRFISVDEFIVVDRLYVKDPFVEQIMQLTIPDQKVSIMEVDSFILYINRDLEEKVTAFVIFKDIATLCEAIEKGFFVPEVQHLYPSRFMSKASIKKYFTPEDQESLKYIESKGIANYFQTDPYQDKTYFSINE